MLVYIVIFTISLLGVWLADIFHDDRRLLVAFSLLALLPPILLAGFRDATVGTDMQVYILSTFERAVSAEQGFFEFIGFYEGDVELLYLLINYVAAQISDRPYLLLLLVHTLIMVPLYVTAMKWRPYLSPAMFMFVFYMIFFQESLSIVRQSIALSFSMLAFTYLLQKRYLWYVACSLLALGFHNTAVIALAFPMVYFAIAKLPPSRYYPYYIGVALAFVLLTMNLEGIVTWLIESGVLDYKYLKYTSALLGDFEPALGVTNLLVKIVMMAYFVAMILVYGADVLVKTFLALAVLDFVFSLSALIVQPLDRISLYFRLMSCLSVPYMLSNYPVSLSAAGREYRLPMTCAWGVLLFFYWFYVYMLGNYDDTADYQLSTSLFT